MKTTSLQISTRCRRDLSRGSAFFSRALQDAVRVTAVISLLVAFLAGKAQAELLVLQPGGSGTGEPAAVWRFDQQSGAAIASFGYENEGFYAMSATADGNVFVTSNILGSYDLYRFSRTGVYLGSAASGLFADFRGVERGADGSLYCVMQSSASLDSPTSPPFVARLDHAGGTPVVSNGPGGVSNPTWLIIGPDRNFYVADRDLGIMRFDGATGASLGVVVPLGRGGLTAVARMIFGPDGRLYVSTGSGNSVLRYDDGSGAFLDAFVPPGSGGLRDARGLAFGADGNLYVSSRETHRVLRFDGGNGAFMNVFVSDARLRFPTDIAFTTGAARDGK